MASGAREVILVYDGQCPLCDRYAMAARIREAVGRLVLVDARDGGLIVDEIRAAGLDLDDGMVVKLDGQLHHGAAALHVLARLQARRGGLHRVADRLFAQAAVARWLYPGLRAGRNLLLRLLGRPRLDASAGSGGPRH